MSAIGPPMWALGGVLFCLSTIGAMLALLVLAVAVRQIVADGRLPRATAFNGWHRVQRMRKG